VSKTIACTAGSKYASGQYLSLGFVLSSVRPISADDVDAKDCREELEDIWLSDRHEPEEMPLQSYRREQGEGMSSAEGSATDQQRIAALSSKLRKTDILPDSSNRVGPAERIRASQATTPKRLMDRKGPA